MPYVVQTWTDGFTPADADHMNHIEAGLHALDVLATAALPTPAGSNGQFLKRVAGSWIPASFAATDIPGYPSDSSKVLRGDGSWAVFGPTPGAPSGSGALWFTDTPPSGWILLDGASYLRSGGGMDDLYALWGTQYGAVDASHFNVPDCRGCFPVMKGSNASVNALGMGSALSGQAEPNRRPQHRTTDTLAVAVGSLSLPDHGHAVSDPGHAHGFPHAPFAEGGLDTGPDAAGSSIVIFNTAAAFTGISIGGITSAPAINGSPSRSGVIGTNNANDALDTGSFLVVNFIVKT